jgi:hypothetical protein
MYKKCPVCNIPLRPDKPTPKEQIMFRDINGICESCYHEVKKINKKVVSS